jgi:hypothetical protein
MRCRDSVRPPPAGLYYFLSVGLLFFKMYFSILIVALLFMLAKNKK